jgi:pseudouridylate synthase / pseudouridine kinase
MSIDANLSLGLQSGICIFNPIPVEHAIPLEDIEIVIAEALQESHRLGIIGKDITPFLLKGVFEQTKGKSLSANIALIEKNARVAAEIALALASLESKSNFLSSLPIEPPTPVPSKHTPHSPSTESPTDIMVIGSMAVDLTCTLQSTSLKTMPLQTSLPARIHTSAGGVAHNVALAASYASSRPVRLVTSLGTDPEGSWLREYAQNIGLDVAFISGGGGETARYVAVHDSEGELVTAAADMRVIREFQDEDIHREIKRGHPKFLAFDGNISPRTVNTIFESVKSDTKGTPPSSSFRAFVRAYSSFV